MASTADWAGDLGRRWAEAADLQDRLLGPFQAAGLAALEAATGGLAGRRVLDLGCGAGASTLALARAGAEATGLDVSPDLLAVARARAAAEGLHPTFREADAAVGPLGGPYDALFSRFGAMFFDAPEGAWASLRAAMAPGAPLVVLAWREVKANPWVVTPLKLVGDLLDPVERPAAGAPGPFGWADPALPEAWLAAAGWREVAFAPVEAEIAFPAEGPDPVAAAVTAVIENTPLSRRVGALDPARREAARARLTEGLAPHLADGAVRLGGAVWAVTARA